MAHQKENNPGQGQQGQGQQGGYQKQQSQDLGQSQQGGQRQGQQGGQGQQPGQGQEGGSQKQPTQGQPENWSDRGQNPAQGSVNPRTEDEDRDQGRPERGAGDSDAR